MNVCALTMVRDDLFYAEKWILHYGAQIGHQNLFVLVHGNDQSIRSLSQAVNFLNIPARVDDTIGRARFNQDRFRLINSIANGLQDYFDFVIVTDIDEFVVVDPDRNQSLPEYLGELGYPITLTVLGLDVYQHVGIHPQVIDLTRPIIQQRPICKVEPLYCKPAITNKRIERALGNHFSNDRTLTFAPDLYLFHLKYMDRSFSLGNQLRRDRLREGRNVPVEKFPCDDGTDFKYRDAINARYEMISKFPVSRDFSFDSIKTAYHRTWRRRRFWVQKQFWTSLLRGNVSEYSFHWRFDLKRYDLLYEIPPRFHEVL